MLFGKIPVKPVLFFLIVFTASSLFSQEVISVLAETPLEANGKEIHIHSTTGVPVLETDSEYIGLSPKDGSILWKSKRNGSAALTSATGNGSEVKDFNEIVGTNLVFASGNMINVVTGDVIIDGEERGLRRLRNDIILPDAELMLFEIGGKGAIYLYGVDPFTNELKFDLQLRESSGLGQMVSEDNAGFGDVKPMLNGAGDLIYPNQKYLALIDLKSGKMKWNEDFKAGYIFTNEAGNRMVIAEKRGAGLGSMMAAASNPLGGGEESGPAKKFGKKVHLIDTETGQSIWKKEKKMDGNVLYITPYDNGFMVVHDEGLNIYDYNAPKSDGRWKKDYGEKGVKRVEFEDEGIMVYFKNKRMLLDPATGDEKWKKAEKLEKEPGGFLWRLAQQGKVEPVKIGQHEVKIYANRVKIEGTRMSFNYETLVIGKDHIVIGHNYYGEDGKGYVGRRQVDLTAIDLNADRPRVTRERVGLKRGMTGMDLTEDGVFVYNDRGFNLQNYQPGGEFEDRKYEYYPDPTAALRTLAAIGAASASVAGTVANTSNMITSDGSSASMESYRRKQQLNNDATDAAFGFTERNINGRIDVNYAFFFRRDGKEGATLFKVDKNTGEEVNKFRFDDLSPLYAIDYVNGRLYYQGKGNFKIFQLNP